jgi:hypothetical protein
MNEVDAGRDHATPHRLDMMTTSLNKRDGEVCYYMIATRADGAERLS